MKFVYLVVAALALFSCSSAQQQAVLQGSSAASQLVAADELLQSGEVESAVLSDEVAVSPEELRTLQHAFADYEASRAVVKDLIDNPEQLLGAVSTIRIEHARLAQAYYAVQDVVEVNWEEYRAVDQARILRWRSQAEQLESTYNRLAAALSDAQTESARTQRVVELVRVLAQIALAAV